MEISWELLGMHRFKWGLRGGVMELKTGLNGMGFLQNLGGLVVFTGDQRDLLRINGDMMRCMPNLYELPSAQLKNCYGNHHF